MSWLWSVSKPPSTYTQLGSINDISYHGTTWNLMNYILILRSYSCKICKTSAITRSEYKSKLFTNQQIRFASRKSLERSLLMKKIEKMRSISGETSLELFEPNIIHGETVEDRKSIFQGHCTKITRIEHVDMFLCKLKENKKIENAFHNMWAYRIDKTDPKASIAGNSASILQDCDDDGEQAAGGRLLSLLQILHIVNVMVVVTRWYGGIQLGPARFKHINNAARDALVRGGFVPDNPSSNDPSKSCGKQSKHKKK